MMINNLWESRGFQLLFGIVGIYTCYWIAGVLQEKMYYLSYSDLKDHIKLLILSNGRHFRAQLHYYMSLVGLLGFLAM